MAEAWHQSIPGCKLLYSLRLAEALRPLMSPEVEFRPVERVGRGRTKYVELLLKNEVSHPVSLRGNEAPGWRCDLCGRYNLYHSGQRYSATEFYRTVELPTQEALFWLRTCLGDVPCVAAEWWLANRAAPWARGLTSYSPGIADNDQIEPSPRLRDWKPLPAGPRRAGKTWREAWLYSQIHLAELSNVPFKPWEL